MKTYDILFIIFIIITILKTDINNIHPIQYAIYFLGVICVILRIIVYKKKGL